MRISDWSSDVCSSDLHVRGLVDHYPGCSIQHPVITYHARARQDEGYRDPSYHGRVTTWPDQDIRDCRCDHRCARHLCGHSGWFHLPLFPPACGGIRPVPYWSEFVGPVHSFPHRASRSEEHTSELQSLMRISYAVFCLKKK